jgi:hypothetical protein
MEEKDLKKIILKERLYAMVKVVGVYGGGGRS